MKKTKQYPVLYIIGLVLTIVGLSILLFLGGRKIYRIIHLHQLMNNNVVVEIPALDIKAPILEGTDNETLRQSVGHFIGTGDVGKGNYCIAGHSSVIYKEFFNNLKYIEKDMKIYLYDKEKVCYTYITEDSFIVEPDELWILNDFSDNRITIVTCNDDGKQRFVVIGKLNQIK